MTVLVSSKNFDFSAYVAAAASAYWGGTTGTCLIDSFLRGTQSFAIVSVFDKALRSLLVRNTEAQAISVKQTLVNPFVEEALYSGVLLTQSRMWIIPRFAASLITGMTAARSLTGRVTPEQNSQGLTPDTKIGFLWAISRELLLFSVASPTLSAVLIAADSCIFALAEVCPKQGEPDLPKFSSPWSYKVISSAFFRFTANRVAQTHGMVASIAQHLLFNISNCFGKNYSLR